jgi:exodeoxyribonuclease VII small subunit
MPKASVPPTPVSKMTSESAKNVLSEAEPPTSYEAAVKELEDLIDQLESGSMHLEQLLTGYQRGAVLLQFCRQRLEAVENQIKVLDDGVLKPWSTDKNE